MQIISLISNDRFLSNFNVSIPTDNLIDRLTDFITLFQTTPSINSPYPIHMKANWSQQYETNWTRTLHKTGFCYTFNFPNSTQFFNREKISKDFEYDEVVRMEKFEYSREAKNQTLNYPLKGPKNGFGIIAEFHELHRIDIGTKSFYRVYMFNETRPFEARDGFHFIIHDTFEVPSDTSNNFMTITNDTLYFDIIPQVTKFDESLSYFSLKE
jgi:hypothetical protein